VDEPDFVPYCPQQVRRLQLADIVAEVGGNPGNWPPVSCCSGVKPVMPLVLLPAAAAGTP
jgi:hypothetical protein